MALGRTAVLMGTGIAQSGDPLVNQIYGPVMSGKVTLKTAIDDLLATSNKKADLVVTPWPG